VDADTFLINDGGDLVFMHKKDGLMGEDGKTYIPPVYQPVATFAQDCWKEVGAID
jgi:hypothetical protein